MWGVGRYYFVTGESSRIQVSNTSSHPQRVGFVCRLWQSTVLSFGNFVVVGVLLFGHVILLAELRNSGAMQKCSQLANG